MSYSIGAHFEQFIQEQIANGRYNNASEIVREGLRLMEEKEMRIQSLRHHITQAIEQGGSYSDQEVDVLLNRE